MKNCLLILIIISAFSIGTTKAQVSSTRLDDIESRLDDIELNQALDKFSLSGSFFNQYESFHIVNERTDLFDDVPVSDLKKELQNDSSDNYLSVYLMRAELNFDVKVTNNLKFFSTLGMSKFWNVSGRGGRSTDENPNFESLAGSYGLRDSSARFDVAYLSYNNTDSPWSLAMGRMTTNNGPPHNKLDGVGRSGTYPFLSYNVIFDGAAAVYKLKSVPENHSLKWRLFYTPFLNVDKNDRDEQMEDSEDSGSTGKSDDKVDSNGALVTLLTEYSIKNLSWAKRLDLIYSIYTFDGYYDATRQKAETDSATCTAVSGDEDYCYDGVEYSGVTSNTVFLGLKKVFDSNIDVSLTYNTFLVRNTGDDDRFSENYLATVRYTFDNSFNAQDMLGIEVIKTDDNTIPVDSNSVSANEFYNIVNGEGYHLYYAKPIGSNQIVRLGYMQYSEGDSKLLVRDLDSTATSTYLRWKVFF